MSNIWIVQQLLNSTRNRIRTHLSKLTKIPIVKVVSQICLQESKSIFLYRLLRSKYYWRAKSLLFTKRHRKQGSRSTRSWELQWKWLYIIWMETKIVGSEDSEDKEKLMTTGSWHNDVYCSEKHALVSLFVKWADLAKNLRRLIVSPFSVDQL